MTGHFTSYKTRTNHELATCSSGDLDREPARENSRRPGRCANAEPSRIGNGHSPVEGKKRALSYDISRDRSSKPSLSFERHRRSVSQSGRGRRP